MNDRPVLDFAIIGAQKSASTYLQDALSLAPAVDLAAGEISFFEDPWFYPGGVAGLEALFGKREPDGRRGIKRPDSLGRPEVPERMHTHLPDLRLVAVLRDPVPRAISAYFHYVRHRWIPEVDLNRGFEALLSGSMQHRHARAAEILEFGRYGEQLSRYLDHFPRSNLLVMSQEDLLREPAHWVASTLRHVGIETSNEPRLPTRASNEGIYSGPRLRLARAVNSLRYEYDEGARLRLRRRFSTVGFAGASGLAALDRLVLRRFVSNERPELSDSLVDGLRNYYADDLAKLAALSFEELRAPWLVSR